MTPTEVLIQAGVQYKNNEISFQQFEAVLAQVAGKTDFDTMTDEQAIEYCLKQDDPEEFLLEEMMNLLPGVPNPTVDTEAGEVAGPGEEMWIDTARLDRLQDMLMARL